MSMYIPRSAIQEKAKILYDCGFSKNDWVNYFAAYNELVTQKQMANAITEAKIAERAYYLAVEGLKFRFSFVCVFCHSLLVTNARLVR